MIDEVGTEWVHMTHPDIPGSISRVTREALDVAWRRSGWVETDAPVEEAPKEAVEEEVQEAPEVSEDAEESTEVEEEI